MVDCLTERLYVFDDFLPGETSAAMRADIDAHFSNPYQHKHETHDVWNYWHVPGQYNYLRTTPKRSSAGKRSSSSSKRYGRCQR